MCLYSCTQNGFEDQDFTSLREVFLLNYGYHELVTLINLEESGLLNRKPLLLQKNSSKIEWNWVKIQETFKLISVIDKTKPTDISFVFSGFCPLSVRLIMFLFGNQVFNPED